MPMGDTGGGQTTNEIDSSGISRTNVDTPVNDSTDIVNNRLSLQAFQTAYFGMVARQILFETR